MDVKIAMRCIRAAQDAGLVRGGVGSQLTDELLWAVVAAARPPGGHGVSSEALVPVRSEITAWVKHGLALVKIGELLERSWPGIGRWRPRFAHRPRVRSVTSSIGGW